MSVWSAFCIGCIAILLVSCLTFLLNLCLVPFSPYYSLTVKLSLNLIRSENSCQKPLSITTKTYSVFLKHFWNSKLGPVRGRATRRTLTSFWILVPKQPFVSAGLYNTSHAWHISLMSVLIKTVFLLFSPLACFFKSVATRDLDTALFLIFEEWGTCSLRGR